MKDKKLLIATGIITAIVLIAALIGFLQTGNSLKLEPQSSASNAQPNINNNQNITLIVDLFGNNKTFSYPAASANTSALGFLEKNNTVNVTNSKYGAFINCINSVCSDNNYYWMYYINGKSANVGASAYFPKSKDTLEFKYEKE